MENDDVKILKEIRDGIRSLGGRIDGTNDRLETLGETLGGRIDATNEKLGRLERRWVESETRLATEWIAVAGTVRDLRDVILEDRELRATVDDHERRIDRLESTHGPS